MTPTQAYLNKAKTLVARVAEQDGLIQQVADRFAKSILDGRMVHIFGSGHSRMMTEEMWPRYGSFPGFNPIVELSVNYYNQVVGCNGLRQAMFIENTSGLADRILRNFDLDSQDCALVVSTSGCNVLPNEMAAGFKGRGMHVTAMISQAHSEVSTSKDPSGKKLQDYADITLDTGAPIGDAMVQIDGLDTPVAPGSTVGGCLLINSIKAEVALRLTQAGKPPKVLTASTLVGSERASELFESAYDEHAHRLSRYYAKIGQPKIG